MAKVILTESSTPATPDTGKVAFYIKTDKKAYIKDDTGTESQLGISGYTDEMAQDAIGNILTDTSNIDFTYNDGAPTISADLTDTLVTPGTYGGASTIPVIDVDQKGRITGATTSFITGVNSRLAGFDPSTGNLTSVPNWVFDSIGSLNTYGTYVPPLDDTIQQYVGYLRTELEVNPVATSTEDNLSLLKLDLHYDRSGSGNDYQSGGGLTAFNASYTMEGNGSLDNMNLRTSGFYAGIGSNTGSVINMNADIISSSIGTGFNVNTFNGIANSLQISGTLTDATLYHSDTSGNLSNWLGTEVRLFGDFTSSARFTNYLISGDSGGNATGFSGTIDGAINNITFLGVGGNINGSGGATIFSHSSTGDITNHFFGLNINHSGDMTNYNGLLLTTTGDFSGNYEGLKLTHTNSISGGYTGVNLLVNGDVTNSLDGFLFDYNGTSTAGLSGLRISGSGIFGNDYSGVKIHANVTTSSNFRGVDINPQGSALHVVGLSVALDNITSTGERATAASFSGGNIGGSFSTTTTSSIYTDLVNTFFHVVNIQNGSPITGTDVITTGFVTGFSFQDDMALGPLGFGNMSLVGVEQVAGVAGKTVDKLSGVAGGVVTSGDSPGGTVDEAISVQALGTVNFGGVLTVNNSYGFKMSADGGSRIGTNRWGISIEDANADNYFDKSLVIGGTTKQPSNSDVALEIQSIKAFIPSKMTTAQRDGLTAVEGMVIYNTDTQVLEFYNGTTWGGV